MTKYNQGWFKASESAGACPAAEELGSFVRGEMTVEPRDAIRDHLTACVWCSEKIARMSEVLAHPAASAFSQAESEPVPTDLDRKTRRHWTSNPLQKIWRSQFLWMILFVIALGLSFVNPRHYKQFLVIALVAGFRWALSERAARHSITITSLGSSGFKDRSTTQNDPIRHSR